MSSTRGRERNRKATQRNHGGIIINPTWAGPAAFLPPEPPQTLPPPPLSPPIIIQNPFGFPLACHFSTAFVSSSLVFFLSPSFLPILPIPPFLQQQPSGIWCDLGKVEFNFTFSPLHLQPVF
ncbi:uncharacterized protein BO72DRAFT_279160 [Aspergillus fijiensis CBS 313.89]|uniref:Uncharacterized protein n=1 Tax=Aspergillus fijiensis CBS 313.89 TaxID=1448319 RepID=A0A8G1VWR7_9EURO|nr:uncharacterized protein BO72DRAFT_279160 [Aspergillus fijiensis CBS 313.89]RAK72274.1 hypothetical protein BO72DRAFT_279160 [Aspergillus fijiensis CBS 313.89]